MNIIKVIPCLDVEKGRVVKGVNFINLKDIGNPAEMAASYQEAGADELVFLDISASHEDRATRVDLAKACRKACSIPFVVGGGMKSLDSVSEVLDAGADKISLGSAAVRSPQLIKEVSAKYGPNRLVVAIDAKKLRYSKAGTKGKWEVYINGGRENTDIDAIEWARKVENLGAGEILLTSMDCDGVKDGYDIPLTRAIADVVSIPVTASGGAGKVEHFVEAVADGHAQGVLAASVFHYGQINIKEVKEALREAGYEVSL
ncbi:MAG: imidazole glycerol phosphate synthase subunit HisF [Coriobacteriia bacterium]|nr:imidazole glycerol phosphate synthase subunit HisF [Coriobacteriia bacterium]